MTAYVSGVGFLDGLDPSVTTDPFTVDKHDTVVVKGGTAPQWQVALTDTNNDTVNVLKVPEGSVGSVSVGDGDDTVNFNGFKGVATVTFGSGHDVLDRNGNDGQLQVNAGAGNLVANLNGNGNLQGETDFHFSFTDHPAVAAVPGTPGTIDYTHPHYETISNVDLTQYFTNGVPSSGPNNVLSQAETQALANFVNAELKAGVINLSQFGYDAGHLVSKDDFSPGFGQGGVNNGGPSPSCTLTDGHGHALITFTVDAWKQADTTVTMGKGGGTKITGFDLLATKIDMTYVSGYDSTSGTDGTPGTPEWLSANFGGAVINGFQLGTDHLYLDLSAGSLWSGAAGAGSSDAAVVAATLTQAENLFSVSDHEVFKADGVTLDHWETDIALKDVNGHVGAPVIVLNSALEIGTSLWTNAAFSADHGSIIV